jgi:hypothetical protein
MANIKKRTVCIIPDVAANEKLTFDNRLPEPTILFGGFVIEPVSAGLLDAAGQAQGRQRAVFHAVFLVADHLLNDTTASAVVPGKSVSTAPTTRRRWERTQVMAVSASAPGDRQRPSARHRPQSDA